MCERLLLLVLSFFLLGDSSKFSKRDMKKQPISGQSPVQVRCFHVSVFVCTFLQKGSYLAGQADGTSDTLNVCWLGHTNATCRGLGGHRGESG